MQPDCSALDPNGKLIIPVDTDNDGDVDDFAWVTTKDSNGVYTGTGHRYPNDVKYYPVDRNGDGKTDMYVTDPAKAPKPKATDLDDITTTPYSISPIEWIASSFTRLDPDRSSIRISVLPIPAYFSMNTRMSRRFHLLLKHSSTASSHSFRDSFLYLFVCIILYFVKRRSVAV